MSDVKKKILVVEDEADIRDLVRYHLEQEGFAVLAADDGEVALSLARRERPALVVLDLMLPGMPGMEVCRTLRSAEATARLPILMLTARATEADKVLGLEMGADDYVTKPFSPRELMARVRAVLRRAYGDETTRPREIYERGRLRVDFDTYEVFLDGKALALSLREFELLKFSCRCRSGSSRAARFSISCGDRTRTSSRARWTCTFAGSGNRSSATTLVPS